MKGGPVAGELNMGATVGQGWQTPQKPRELTTPIKGSSWDPTWEKRQPFQDKPEGGIGHLGKGSRGGVRGKFGESVLKKLKCMWWRGITTDEKPLNKTKSKPSVHAVTNSRKKYHEKSVMYCGGWGRTGQQPFWTRKD